MQNALSATALNVTKPLFVEFSVSGLISSQPLSVAILYGTGETWTVVGREYNTTAGGDYSIALSTSVSYSTSGKFLVLFGTGTCAHSGTEGTWAYTTTTTKTVEGEAVPVALTISGLTIIPEPSMFGLLAGTLALGLAGTRRRRSK